MNCSWSIRWHLYKVHQINLGESELNTEMEAPWCVRDGVS